MLLRFSDGIEIDTSGPLRLLFLKKDGWYVIGDGMCSPENDYESAKKTLEQLKSKEVSK